MLQDKLMCNNEHRVLLKLSEIVIQNLSLSTNQFRILFYSCRSDMCSMFHPFHSNESTVADFIHKKPSQPLRNVKVSC